MLPISTVAKTRAIEIKVWLSAVPCYDKCMAGFTKLHKAIKIAAKAHKKQDRDGDAPLPYVTHPIDVLNRLRYEADVTDEVLLCAAILHDTLEETDITEKQIEKAFGKPVAALVKEVTREAPDGQMKKLPEKDLWEIRNNALLMEIDKMSDSAKKLKLADRCSNLTSALKTRTGEKLERYIRQSRQILEHIDREVSPPLWDTIQKLLETPEAAVPSKRKNLRENGAAKTITS